MNEMTFKVGETLYTRGSTLEGLFFIKDGAIGLSKTATEKGQDVFVEIVRSGGFLEPDRFFAELSARYTAKVIEQTVIHFVHRNALDLYISTHPLRAMTLLTYLSDLLESENEKLTIKQGHYSKQSVQIVEAESDFVINAKRNYYKRLPESHQEYLFTKEIVCPVCEYTFKVNQIKSSQMAFDHMDDDFRKHFYDIDDMWYHIWRCPSCHYAHFANEFHRINNLVRAELKVALPRFEKPQHEVLVKENYQQVFDDHYQANLLMHQTTKSSFVKARLWQSYVWLLEDVGDMETAMAAKHILKKYYEDAWLNGNMEMQKDDEVKLAVRIALLCVTFGEIRDARNYLLKAVQLKPQNKMLQQKIQDMMIELKQQDR